MNFDTFWYMLSLDLKTRSIFKTLTQSKAFEARMTDVYTVTVTSEHTRKPRDVCIGEFLKMWNIGKNDSRRMRSHSTNQRYSKFRNSSCVSALIDHVVEDQGME